MFEVELLGLLNRYKKSSDKEEQEKLKTSIILLVNESSEELEHFLNSQEIDDKTKQFLESCKSTKTVETPMQGMEKELQKSKEQAQSNENSKDVEIVMTYYKSWLDSFQRNSGQINEECSKVIKDILNFYIVNGFEVLEQILAIEDTQDFDKFKNHLKNNIRAYYGQKINDYLDGPYKELGFFAKRKKTSQIKGLIKEIGKYKFDTAHIAEVLR